MKKLDVSEMYSSSHNLKNFFKRLKTEQLKGRFFLHIFWKKSTYQIDYAACKIEDNGKTWAICVKVDISDEFHMTKKEIMERNNPIREVADVPAGVEKIAVDRIRQVGKFILNGYEADIGLPSEIW